MRKGILVLALLAAACGDQTARPDIAEGPSITPQKILYPDIEANNLYGLSCAFVPEGGGIGAIALAMTGGGYLKLDGQVVAHQPANPDQDVGPPEMSFQGEKQDFVLSLDEASFRRDGIETATYDAHLSITDKGGTELYSANGMAQCGA